MLHQPGDVIALVVIESSMTLRLLQRNPWDAALKANFRPVSKGLRLQHRSSASCKSFSLPRFQSGNRGHIRLFLLRLLFIVACISVVLSAFEAVKSLRGDQQRAVVRHAMRTVMCSEEKKISLVALDMSRLTILTKEFAVATTS